MNHQVKHFPYNTRVRIRGIKDEDADLNGQVGITRPKVKWKDTDPKKIFGDIGIEFPDGRVANVRWKEIERI